MNGLQRCKKAPTPLSKAQIQQEMNEHEREMLKIERAKVNAKIAEIATTLASSTKDAQVAFNGIYTNINKKVWEK